MHQFRNDYGLLAALALFWGASYLFIKIAVAEIPPLTLIALRVAGAAGFLWGTMRLRNIAFPCDPQIWRSFLVQAFFNSIGAWTVLAWGQQFVSSGLASVLNSTSPIFVILGLWVASKGRHFSPREIAGAGLGVGGVILIVGSDSLTSLGDHLAGQIACLAGAVLYAGAALYGKRFAHVDPLVTATGTMIWATLVLVPLALAVEHPWQLTPSWTALGATAILAVMCTGVALLIYFRLVQSLGSVGVASQSYLRAGVGLALGAVFLGETLSFANAVGVAVVILGVVLINWPQRAR